MKPFNRAPQAKLSALKIVMGLLLTPLNSAQAAHYYNNEINALQERTKQYVQHADTRLKQLVAFRILWEQIAFDTRDLEITATWQPTPSDPGMSESAQNLQSLMNEKVLVESTLAKLSEVKPRLEKALVDSSAVVAQYEDLKPYHEGNAADLRAEIAALEQSLAQRKQAVDEDLEAWRLWQLEASAEKEADFQTRIAHDVEREHLLGQVDQAFTNLRIQFLDQLYHGSLGEADEVLSAHVWFRSTVTLYFVDKALDASQSARLQMILRDAQTREQSLISQLTARRLALRGQRVSAVNHLSGAFQRMVSSMDHDVSSEHRQSQAEHDWEQTKQHAGEMPEKSWDKQTSERRIDMGNGREGTAHQSASFEKGVCTYDAKTGRNEVEVKISMTGYVSYDRSTHLPREAVEMPNGPELQHSVDADLRKEMQDNTISAEGRLRFSCDGSLPGSTGKGTEGAGKLSEGSEKLHEMITQARRESRSGNEREDLNEMDSILKNYDNTQSVFGKITQESLTETGQAQNRAHNQSQKLSQRQALPPAHRNRPPTGAQSAQAKVQKLTQTVLQLALGGGNSGEMFKSLVGFVSSLARTSERGLNHASQYIHNALVGADARAAGQSTPSELRGVMPVEGAIVTSEFNPARLHPITHKIQPHRGVDLGIQLGTEVHASDDGVVKKVGTFTTTHEDYVEILHTDGTTSRYLHVDGSVQVGEQVKAGTPIGNTDQSGQMSGPHLHYEYWDQQGNAIDPRNHLPLDR